MGKTKENQRDLVCVYAYFCEEERARVRVRKHGSVAAVCALPKTAREKRSEIRKGEGALEINITDSGSKKRIVEAHELILFICGEKRGRREGAFFLMCLFRSNIR